MRRIVTILLILAAVFQGMKYLGLSKPSFGQTELTETEVRTLAAHVKPGDIVMYSMTECPYCAQASSWLNNYGFAFTECNMSIVRRCQDEMLALGGSGTPYLVVRGYHMKNGFDTNEFLRVLGQDRRTL